nr:hypothetical protein [Tanacetum cinerariifolium]
MEEEENRALQSINETPAEKAAKRGKLNEEVEDLKRHLEIVLDEDDDERFSTLKPKNFSDDFHLNTLRAMFEKPDILAQVWKNQSGKKVPTLKVYSRLDDKCCKTSGQRG